MGNYSQSVDLLIGIVQEVLIIRSFVDARFEAHAVVELLVISVAPRDVNDIDSETVLSEKLEIPLILSIYILLGLEFRSQETKPFDSGC